MKILLFLAHGFEEVEALTLVDYLRRVDIEVDTVSITGDKLVTGAHDISVMADSILDENLHKLSYDGLIIPGGMPGATNLRDDDRVIDLVKDFNEKGKLVAAICAGPIVFARAGIIEGRSLTSYPGFEEDLKGAIYKEDRVVRDGNMITSRGPSLAIYFALEIVNYLLGEEITNNLKKDLLLED